MRFINFPAGLGTILIFIGIYCFKAIYPRKTERENNEYYTQHSLKKSEKVILLLTGGICIVGGILLLIKSIKDIN